MSRYIALLRGINVGGNVQIAMPALVEVFESLGFDDVVTYIRSGNIVFSGAKPDAAAIEAAIASELGLTPSVLLRTHEEMAAVAKDNPYLARESDPKKLHVVFLSEKPAAAELDPDRSPGDSFTIAGREVYLHLPNGMGRTKLSHDWFERGLGVRATARNWNTVLKLVELSS